MRKRSEVPMNSVFLTLSPHSFSAPLEGWEESPQWPIRTSPPSSRSIVMGCIRCHLSFSLLHSAIVHERSMFEAWYVPRLETPLELIIHIQWPCSSCSYCLSFCFIFFLPPIGSFLALALDKVYFVSRFSVF